MIRFYKKWWFVRQLYKEESSHCLEKPDEFFYANGKYWIERAAFLKQITRQKLKEENNPEKGKKIMNEYNSIIDSLISEDHWIEQSLSQDKRFFISTNPKSEDKLEVFDLLQEELSRYSFIPAILGSTLLIEIIRFIFTGNL